MQLFRFFKNIVIASARKLGCGDTNRGEKIVG